MHQLVLRLRAERDCAWERQYHRKIRGRFDQALEGSAFDGVHDTKRAAFTFGEPTPYASEIGAGESLGLIVAAPDADILRAIADDLRDDPTLTAGAFVFEVRAADPVEVDVGPPGTVGSLTTASGAVLTVEPDHETNDGIPTYWTDRKHDVETFRENLIQTVDRLIRKETDGEPLEADPFDRYEHRKTYAADITVTPQQQLTLIASKWDLDYEVRDDHHRRVLNTMLTHGIGSKRAYGFGCLTPTDVARRARQEVASVHG